MTGGTIAVVVSEAESLIEEALELTAGRPCETAALIANTRDPPPELVLDLIFLPLGWVAAAVGALHSRQRLHPSICSTARMTLPAQRWQPPLLSSCSPRTPQLWLLMK